MVGTWGDAAVQWADSQVGWSGVAPPVVARIEVEFESGTWTDISASTRQSSPLTFTGGRSDTDERVQPGRLSGVVLNNNAGHFTVGNTAGDYYPNVTSGKRIRVSIKDPGSRSTYYERFTGYIDGWPMRWESGQCFVTVSASDALTQLLPPIDTDLWMASVMTDAAEAYWPMTDAWQDSGHREYSGGPTLAPTGTPPQPTETGPPGVPTPLPMPTAAGQYWTASGLPVGTTPYASWNCTVLFKASSPPSATTEIVRAMKTGGSLQIAARVDTDGYPSCAYWTGSVWVDDQTGTGTTPKVNICDGRWWVVQAIAAYDGSYYTHSMKAIRCDDGKTTNPIAAYTNAATTLLDQAELQMRVGPETTADWSATFGHAAWRPAYLWGAVDADVVDAFMGLPDQDLTAADWGTLFDDLSPFDVTATVPTTRGSSLYRRPFTGTWLDLWRKAEDVDGGVTFAERDGTVTWLSGAHRTTPTDGTNAVIPLNLTASTVASLEVAADRLKMVNDATATLKRVGEAGDQIMDTLNITDEASITAAGRRAVSIDAYGTRASGVVNVAGELLEPTEVPRIPQIAVDAFTLPTAGQQAILFGNYDSSPVGVWSLVGVTDLPSTGGFPSQWLGRVEGWSETIGATQWRIVFNTSFAGNRVGDSTWAKVGTMRLG